MIYKIGTMNEIALIENVFPVAVVDCVFDCVGILDEAYCANRDYHSVGGYALITNSDDDLVEVKKTIDIESLLCEWINLLDNDYLSALYLISDDYAIMLIAPKTFQEKINSLP